MASVNETKSLGFETLVKPAQDGFELSVHVDGVHCAACIQKIESTLKAQDGIDHARLNFTTHRLNFSWHGMPEAANDYVHAIEGLGYSVRPYDVDSEDNALKKEERFLLLCLGVAGFAAGNIMLLSVGLWSTTAETMGHATRDFMHYVSAFIALPTILFSGRPFFRSALKVLRGGHTNMDVPISLAIMLAGGMSLYETLNHGEHVYFDSAVMLLFFLLIGRYLDFRARKNARSSASDLLGSLSGFATVIEKGKPRRIAVRDLKEGMIIRVVAGEKFPADGVLLNKVCEIDTALITGETLPRSLKKGEMVYAGTINLSIPVEVRVQKAADNTVLANILRLMEQAGQGQAKYVRIADRAARLYTPVIHTLAAAAFLYWFFMAGLDWQSALMIAVTVLIITCPCALGLAVPVVQVLATGRLMKNGVLVKSGDALERLSAIDTVLLDKTGTLTLGHPVLEGGYQKADLKWAASLAVHSGHPISKALLKAYDGELYPVKELKEYSGKGVQGTYRNKTLRLGSRAWCGDKNSLADTRMELWLHIEGENPVPFYFSDQLRSDAPSVIERLKARSVKPVLLSGDLLNVVETVARICGIDEFYGEKTPPEKFEILESLKQNNHKVLMVGDGLNDAPVLAGADVSMAPGSAIELAQNAADIVFMGEKLCPVYDTYMVARRSQSLVKQNFALAVLYNVIAVPLALSGLVTPLIAAAAMSGSSLLVIANSFRLRLQT